MFASVKRRSNSARNQIAIKEVRDGILTLSGDRYRSILEVSPVNFELRSEQEQDVIIDTYESFLNSVGIGIQILVRTREVDMDRYLEEFAGRLENETEAIYRQQLADYDEFIRSLISDNRILARRFYIIVPYDQNEKDFRLAAEQLDQRLDIISKGLMRLNMHARRLESLEVLDLFYSFYSPAQAKVQPLTEQAINLIHTELVRTGDSHE